MTTRLYLDIDGVINVLGRNPGFDTVQIAGYPIRMNTHLVRQFMALFDEVVWATTWVLHDEALAAMEAHIGLEERQAVIPTTKEELDNGEWSRSTGKGPAVARHFDADPVPVGRALWLDDLLGPDDRYIAEPRGIITHAPNPHRGAYPFITTCVDDGRPWKHQSQEYFNAS